MSALPQHFMGAAAVITVGLVLFLFITFWRVE